MSRILVLQHVAAEPAGTLDPLLRERGHRIRYVNFERDPVASPSMDRYHGLIVLGGSMNVADRHDRRHLLTEMGLIEQALQQDKPVLGICLGAQLLAHVLGAPVRRMERAEIGWYHLDCTATGQRDRVTRPLANGTPIFQWHSWNFDIPNSAEHLAQTESCRNQAFRYGHKAYGFQFHLEADESLIGRWLSSPAYRREIESAGLDQSADDVLRLSPASTACMRQVAVPVFENFLDLVGPAKRLMPTIPALHHAA
ncbi:MAG TPA: gamma-glutamyl-gamma-aminobutyrate hydrolase family protein [Chiayiivirga sp.]|nr:gamma-glutamyl-gamma-aminobutyrate hydrolase family protein [Chiayiivirga sp.]